MLKAFDKFHGGRPQIDEVHWYDVPEDATKLIGLEKGTFDLVYPEAVSADFEARVRKMGAVIDRRGPGSQDRFYINMTRPPFDDIRVRRAFMHAIDRKAIKETLYPGSLARLATSPVPAGYFGHIAVELPAHDPELARKLLAEADHPSRKNLNPFVLFGGIRLPDADPWLSLFFHSSEIPDPATGNKGTNFAHYRAIDDLLAQGRRERDPKKRAAIYHEAQRRIMRDAVCLPLNEVPGEWARNPKRVSTPFDPEYGEDALHFTYNYPELLKLLN